MNTGLLQVSKTGMANIIQASNLTMNFHMISLLGTSFFPLHLNLGSSQPNRRFKVRCLKPAKPASCFLEAALDLELACCAELHFSAIFFLGQYSSSSSPSAFTEAIHQLRHILAGGSETSTLGVWGPFIFPGGHTNNPLEGEGLMQIGPIWAQLLHKTEFTHIVSCRTAG